MNENNQLDDMSKRGMYNLDYNNFSENTVINGEIIISLINNGVLDKSKFTYTELKEHLLPNTTSRMLEDVWFFLSSKNTSYGCSLHLERLNYTTYGLITDAEWEHREKRHGRLK